MVKISFYRRLQKELSTDIGIVSGNILGENFILEYNLEKYKSKYNLIIEKIDEIYVISDNI